MKRFLLIIIQCLIGLGVSYAVDEGYRDLTSAEGKTLRAKILSYDKSSDTVLIERENHKRYTVSPDLFCDADKSIIRNWESAGKFLSNSSLKVSLKFVEDRVDLKREVFLDDIDPSDIKVKDYMSMDCYTITLDNLTTYTLDNIKVEIIQFITHGCLNPHHNLDYAIKVQTPIQLIDVFSIKANSTKEISSDKLNTESVIIEVNSKVFSKDIIAIEGVWVRMTMKLPDGTEVMRELKEPENKWAEINWSDATKAIDLNTYQIIDIASLHLYK